MIKIPSNPDDTMILGYESVISTVWQIEENINESNLHNLFQSQKMIYFKPEEDIRR